MRISRALALAALVLTSACVYTSRSDTYADLLAKARAPEIREKLEGTIRSNSQIIRDLGQKPKKGWLRIAVVGDSVSRRNLVYRDLLARISELDPPPDLVVNLGDFTRGKPEHFSYYFDTIKGYPLPLIHLMGNHEDQYPAEMIFRTVFGERDFFFDYADVRFIFMGSEKLGFSRQRLDWLEDRLKDERPAKKIFLSHEFMTEAVPEVFRGIYAHFVHKIKNTDKVLELLDRYQVPLIVSGHLHRYYEKTHRGSVMIITGGGGQAAFVEPKAKEPRSTKKKHFTLIDLPTGQGQELVVVLSALGRDARPLFMTSCYRWAPSAERGELGLQLRPCEDPERDPTLPQYVRDRYRTRLRKTP